MSTVMLVGGGVRSGKSTFALRWARSRGPKRVFLATGTVTDDEMRARFARHQEERAADFSSIEEPLAVPGALRSIREADVVVVDCVTFWLSNMLLRDDTTDEILKQVDELVVALKHAEHDTALVTNEVGFSVHPETALGRRFQEICGFAHQRLAAAADEVYVAVLGAILRIHPSPVECVRP